MKLSLDTPDGDDIDSYGFLYYYDRVYDKQPGAKTSERKLNVLERAAYNVTTSSDPIIQELADKDEGTIFATDNILSMLMCAPRSVYSWDLVITKHNGKVFIDKREGSSLDMVTVNENAADAPLEVSEGNKDNINNPGALMIEATHINHVFPIQVVTESDSPSARKDMPNEHPFYNAQEETDPPASKAYKYRRFDLSLAQDEEPLHLVVRTELDAVVNNAVTGEEQHLVIKALNEFDNKAQGSGGALDWRTKLSSGRGAVVATEMKNNSCKLARWTIQSILAKADIMKLGYVCSIAMLRAFINSSQFRLPCQPTVTERPRRAWCLGLQASRLCRPDEPQHCQRMGYRAHDCRHGPQDGRRKICSCQGPQQERPTPLPGASGYVRG